MQTVDEQYALGKSVSLDHFGNLEGHQFLSLVTFRRDGRAVPTPVWFADAGGRLFVTTVEDSGKVRRIRRNPSVTVAPCDRGGRILGGGVAGRARVLSPEEEGFASRALAEKYGFQYRALGVLRSVVARDRGERVFLEIVAPEASPPSPGVEEDL